MISNLEQWCILNRIWCDDGSISIHEFSAHLAVHSTQLGSTHTTTTTRTTMTTTTMTRRRRRSVPFLFTSFPPTWQCTLPNLDQPICSQKYVDLSQDNTSARDFLPQNIWDILGIKSCNALWTWISQYVPKNLLTSVKIMIRSLAFLPQYMCGN